MQRSIPLLVAAALAGALAGCGAPEFQYPHDAAEGVYFKVPSAWTVFDETAEYYDGRIDGGAQAQPVKVWVIDAADDASPDHVDDDARDAPVGSAQIIALSPSVGEQVSVSSVRALGFEFDPVAPATGLDETWEVSVDQPLRTDDGISGAVAVFNYRNSATDPWLTQARLVFIDPTSPKAQPRAYLLDLYCTAECFEAHRADIFAVLDSWRIDL